MKKYIVLFIVVMTLFVSGNLFAQSKSFIFDNTAFVAYINVPEILKIMTNPNIPSMYDMIGMAGNKNASTDMNFYELFQSSFLNLVLVTLGEIEPNDIWEPVKHWEENGFVPTSIFKISLNADSKAYAQMEAKIDLKKFYSAYKDKANEYGIKNLKEEKDGLTFESAFGNGVITSNGITIGSVIGKEVEDFAGKGWKTFVSNANAEDLFFAFEGDLNAFKGIFNPDDVLSTARNEILYFYNLLRKDTDRVRVIVKKSGILASAKYLKDDVKEIHLKSLKRYLAEQGSVEQQQLNFNPEGRASITKVESLTSTIVNKTNWLGVMVKGNRKAMQAGVKYLQAMGKAALVASTPQIAKSSIDTCLSNLQIIARANSMNMSNVDFSNPNRNIDINDFVKNGYLDEIPVCPDGGEYTMDGFIEPKCSVHGGMMDLASKKMEEAKAQLENLTKNADTNTFKKMFLNPKAECRDTIRTLQVMVKEYMKEKNITDFSKVKLDEMLAYGSEDMSEDMPEDLKAELENVFKCPEKGNYELLNTGKIKCSVHGTVDE